VTGRDPSELALPAAIVTSGTLPEEWREPRVPVVIPEAEARDLAVAAATGSVTGTGRAELTTYGFPESEAGVTAAWAIVVHGSFASVSCGRAPESPATRGPCPVADTELVILDAVTGAFLEGQVPAP
jgi:hypothetical protein